MSDPINPDHYKNDSSGLECIQLSEHLNSGLLQQAFQYVWRSGHKGDAREDLKKAMWFIGREHHYRTIFGRSNYGSRTQDADDLFAEWREKVDSNLRAAILANIWRIDDDSVDPSEFYTLCELVEAWRGTF